MLKKIKNSSETDNLLHKISDYIQINKTEIKYINKKNL